MKICYLNHDMYPHTGAGRFGRELLRAIGQVFPHAAIEVLTSRASGFANELSLISPHRSRLLMNLWRIRREFRKFDIIHALDGFPYGIIAVLFSLGLGKKVVITAIGSGALKPFQSLFTGMLLGWAYRRADRLIAVSNYTRREILRHLPTSPIAVVNHGVDAEKFSGDPRSQLTGEEWEEIQRLRPYIVSVGSDKPRKGFVYSIPAFAELARNFSHLRYVIVGEMNRGPTRKAIQESGCAHRITIYSRLSDAMLAALYQNAEFFWLLPYNAAGDVEGFGLVFLEAAAAGLPVIGTRESAVEDALEDGRNGFLVPPRDSHAAARAAAQILASPALRSSLCSASRDFARRMIWVRVARAYQNIYTSLV